MLPQNEPHQQQTGCNHGQLCVTHAQVRAILPGNRTQVFFQPPRHIRSLAQPRSLSARFAFSTTHIHAAVRTSSLSLICPPGTRPVRPLTPSGSLGAIPHKEQLNCLIADAPVGAESEIANYDGQQTYFKWKDRDGEDVVELAGGHPRSGACFSWREASGQASRRLLGHGKAFCQRTDRYVQPRTLHRESDRERAGAGFSRLGARNHHR